MSEAEPISVARGATVRIQPRAPHREIAELLAAAIVRSRIKNDPGAAFCESEVSLGFSGHQRVNTNPSQPEGVHV